MFKNSALKSNWSLIGASKSDRDNAKSLIAQILVKPNEETITKVKEILSGVLPSLKWRVIQVLARARLYARNICSQMVHTATVPESLILIE